LSGCFIFVAVSPSNTRIFLHAISRLLVYARSMLTKWGWIFSSRDNILRVQGLSNKKTIVKKYIFDGKLHPFESGAFSKNSKKREPKLIHLQ
jgi:hypothetical protein